LRFIVVDNGSTDGSADFVEDYWNVTLLRQRKKHGFGAALRASLPYVTGKYVAFLNEDIKLERDWLLNLVRVMEQRPEVGIAGAVMRDAKRSLYDGYYYSPWLAFAGSMKGERRKESVKNVPYVGLGKN
jgi:GT2 family glycosyltransferase